MLLGFMGRCKAEMATIACGLRTARGRETLGWSSTIDGCGELYYAAQQVPSTSQEESDRMNGTRSRGSDVGNCVGLMGNGNEKLQPRKKILQCCCLGVQLVVKLMSCICFINC